MTKQDKLLNVLCLYSQEQNLYIGFGIELFIVSGFSADQQEFIESFKILTVASFNPQCAAGQMVQVPISEFRKVPQEILTYWLHFRERNKPFVTNLDGHPIHDGKGRVLVEPKDMPYYHLHFWLDVIEGPLPQLAQDAVNHHRLLPP